YLYLKTDNIDRDIINNDKVLISRYIISILSLWFEREQTIYETEMHHKDKFVWNLIQGDESQLRESYTQAPSIGYDLSKPYICIIGQLSNLNNSYKLYRSNFSSYEEWEFNCVKSVKTQIIRIGQTMEHELMLTYQKERLIIFLEAIDSDLEKQANDFIDIIENSVKPLYPELILSWGIGIYKIEYPDFNKTYLDAKISLEFGQHRKVPGFRYDYHNTSIYRLLSILLKDKETISIVSDIIGRLVKHDDEGSLNLLNTFK